MTKRVLFIHAAGNKRHPAGSGKLIAYLQEQLGSDYEVLAPDMPDPDHPRYLAWRDQIEQELASMEDECILIGHSLGGSLLLKTLAEGIFHKRIAGLFLVSTPYWGKDEDWQLEYALPEDFVAKLPPISRIVLYHSQHDEIIPSTHLWLYKEKLPQATVRLLDGKEHSFLTGLPELVSDLKNLEYALREGN